YLLVGGVAGACAAGGLQQREGERLAGDSEVAKAQGMADVSVAVAGATGGLASGVVVSAGSFPVLALASGILALAILPAVAATAAGR
ncbi:hypothetical protein ABZ044_33535, partial [Streptomyces werraensis]